MVVASMDGRKVFLRPSLRIVVAMSVQGNMCCGLARWLNHGSSEEDVTILQWRWAIRSKSAQEQEGCNVHDGFGVDHVWQRGKMFREDGEHEFMVFVLGHGGGVPSVGCFSSGKVEKVCEQRVGWQHA